MAQPSIENLVYIFQKYTQANSQVFAVRFHAYMFACGLESHTSLAKHLFCMLVEVGSYHSAHKVFKRLGSREGLYCTSLIDGFIKSGELPQALTFYLEMREDSGYPSAPILVALLKACACLKDVTSGCEIHADVSRAGLVKTDPFVGSALVDMYAKCGVLARAKETFDMLPVRDVVTWTALIAGYVQFSMDEEALKCLGRMQVEGISPNAATFVCSLKACGSIGALDTGRDIHADIAMRSLLESNQIVGNALVDMYAKCGALKEAHYIFDKLPVRDVVSWNALIGGYTEHDHTRDALICFKCMQSTGVLPNVITFACSLKACGSICDVYMGQAIHSDLDRRGLLQTSQHVCTALVDMYARCGMLAKAKEVFDKFLIHDIVAWNTLITGYIEHENGQEALQCFKQMQEENVSPSAITFFCSLKACGNIGDMIIGREIHAETARKGLLETNGCIGSALIEMYAKRGMLSKAQEVFDKLGVHDVVSWNALIAGYIEGEHCEDALDCFKQMQIEGVLPDLFTFTYILKACGSIGARDEGIVIHAEVARKGLLHRHVALGSMVIDFYAKCSLLSRAQEVFDKLLDRDLVTWTTLMAAYVQHKCGEEALNCLNKMQREGNSPDAIACTCSLKACGSLEAIEKGREIHADILRRGFSKGDLGLSIALIDMYAKCGFLVEAQELFDDLSDHDVVSWNVLIVGYVKYECVEKAFGCFRQMQLDGVSPDAITYACILKACGSIGATDKGSEIHFNFGEGWLENDLVVGTALVDMYAKGGLLATAQDAFDKLLVRDAASWNALITGYAQQGELESVLANFDKMRGEGARPSSATFLSVLNACSHAGLVDKGYACFKALRGCFGLTPTLEHLTCMIDFLGRAGQLDQAAVVIENIPYQPNILMWLTVLGACRKWENAELGRHAFEMAMQLNDKEASAYVCAGNIFADADLQEGECEMVEKMRDAKTSGEEASGGLNLGVKCAHRC